MNNPGTTKTLSEKLLHWYDSHARELPWRTGPQAVARGERTDPYRVWLSEIMLQQTTVGAVKEYFAKFVRLWPTVEALAAADEEDVLKAWAGLGYYSRARNLHKAARQVVDQYGGKFHQTFEELIKLTGVGRYTAAAIASIAFDEAEPVVDGNVERVFTRVFAIQTPLPAAKPEIYAHVSTQLARDRPGDFAQACMDLGATICSPKRPKCMVCPLRDDCAAMRLGDPELFPVKLPQALKPKRFGAAFVAVNTDGAVLLNKRSDKGLLAGMTGVPTSGWDARTDGVRDISAAPFEADWQECGSIRHVFTHFELELFVFKTSAAPAAARRPDLVSSAAAALPGHWWSKAEDLGSEALPTVMKKVIEAAIPRALKRSIP
ncbi:MAG: A/G-specific adenine glycosylase [Rhizobiaceae bacterium]